MNLLTTFVAASVTLSIFVYISSVASTFIEETFVVISPSFIDLYNLTAPLLLQTLKSPLSSYGKMEKHNSNISRCKLSTCKIKKKISRRKRRRENNAR